MTSARVVNIKLIHFLSSNPFLSALPVVSHFVPQSVYCALDPNCMVFNDRDKSALMSHA